MVKKAIKFIKSYSPYNSGEVAGFDEKFAASLIKDGYATAVVDPKSVSDDVVLKVAAAVKPTPKPAPAKEPEKEAAPPAPKPRRRLRRVRKDK